jgi:hypothetical protein
MPRRQFRPVRRRRSPGPWVWAGFAGSATLGALTAALITSSDADPPAHTTTQLAAGQVPDELKGLIRDYLEQEGYVPLPDPAENQPPEQDIASPQEADVVPALPPLPEMPPVPVVTPVAVPAGTREPVAPPAVPIGTHEPVTPIPQEVDNVAAAAVAAPAEIASALAETAEPTLRVLAAEQEEQEETSSEVAVKQATVVEAIAERVSAEPLAVETRSAPVTISEAPEPLAVERREPWVVRNEFVRPKHESVVPVGIEQYSVEPQSISVSLVTSDDVEVVTDEG